MNTQQRYDIACELYIGSIIANADLDIIRKHDKMRRFYSRGLREQRTYITDDGRKIGTGNKC